MLNPQELKQFEEVIQLVVRNEISQAVKDSEERMIQRIIDSENKLRKEIKQMGNDIGDMIDGVLLTQIEEKADKKEFKKVAEVVVEHDKVIKTLKAGFAN